MNQPIVSSDKPITVIGGAQTAPDVLTEALNCGKTVVCADGGADFALSQRLQPAAVIGDMDSIAATTRAAFEDVLHPIPEQDSTDFDKVLRNIAAPLVIGVGFSGARIDHELGSLNVLVRHPHRPCILLAPETVTLLCPPRITLDLAPGTPVSLFPMGEVGCESEGLRWPTTGLRFAPDGRLGTLNKAEGPVRLAPDAPLMLLILPRAAFGVTQQALMTCSARWPAPAG